MSVLSQATTLTWGHNYLPFSQSCQIPYCNDCYQHPVISTATSVPVVGIAFKYDNFKTGVVFITISETERCACEVGAVDWEDEYVDLYSNQILKEFFPQYPIPNPQSRNSYTHAAAASQPKPLRIITASSPVISKMVDTS